MAEPSAVNNMVAVNERELLVTVGARLAMLDHAETFHSKVISFGQRTVTEIINVVLSSDSKYLIVSVKVAGSGDATMIAAANDKPGATTAFRKPRAITYARASRFEGMAFSANADLVAAFTEAPAEGVLIFDRVRATLMRQIPLATSVFAVSFNPENDTRICTTGTRNLFQFWRYTNKAVHSAPIVGLMKEECMYTCHVWLPENRLVAGTDKGLLVLVQACDVQSTHAAFGTAASHNYRDDGKVHSLRTFQNFVVAASAINCVSVFELKRVASTTSVGNSNQATLVLRGRFHLQGAGELRTLHISMKRDTAAAVSGPDDDVEAAVHAAGSSDSSVIDCITVVGAMTNTISLFDLQLPPVSHALQASVDKDVRATTPGGGGKAVTGQSTTDPEWKDVQGRNVYDYHSEKVDSIAVSVRSSTFITSSEKDLSVRAWDYNKPFVAGDLVEHFHYHPAEMPHCVDLHPTGLFAAFACNDEVREAAITQSGMEVVRRIPTKQPFVSSDGISLANSLPVSLVKYAHGGHLLAVVCGKIVQLFHMYDLDYSVNKNHPQNDKRGRPKRVMSLVHVTQVTDVVFSTDDAVLFSCSVEGTILSHAVSCFPTSSPLMGEYVTRGVTAAKLVTSESKVLVASYISLAAGAVDARKQGSTAASVAAADLGNYSYLAVWQGGRLTDSPAVVYLDVPAKEICLQTTSALAGGTKVDLCVIGCVDGSLLLCLLPMPTVTRVLTAAPGPAGGMPLSSSGQYHVAEFDLSLVADKRGAGAGNATVNTTMGGNEAHAAATIASTFPGSDDADDDYPRAVEFLDESRCRSFLFHAGAVSGIVISADSKRIFSTSVDGAIFMFQLAKLKKGGGGGGDDDSDSDDDSHQAHSIFQSSAAANEGVDMGESAFMLANKAAFETMRDKALEDKYLMEDKIKDSVAALSKVSEQRDIEVDQLQTQLKREVGKRDAIILREREEHLKQKHKLQGQLKALEKKRAEEISRVEMSYEQKLATEALYLDRMRQAYEEMVLNARLDKKKAMDAEIEAQLRSSADAAFFGKLDAQKQKESLLLYVEFINARHAEVIASFEKAQEKERSKFKKELAAAHQAVTEAKAEGIEKIVMANLNVKQLNADVATKEDQVLRLKSDLEWSEGRILKLEAALQQATGELKKRTEMYEKWEFKAGDQQQQISEMERIRRALTHQLHGLRHAIGPKDEHILRLSEKLEEMDREYDHALRAVSEKEVALSQKSAVLHMLQNQVRDLRVSSSRKEASLRRAALLFEQYKRSLMEDSTVAGRISNGTLGNGVGPADGATKTKGNATATTAIAAAATLSAAAAKTDSALALQRLDDVLKAHAPSAVEAAANADGVEPETLQDTDMDTLLAEAEKERQVMQLHKNVNALKTNLEKSESLAAIKVKKHLTDNEHLVQEVNRMRHEIRSLSTENQRLLSVISETQRAARYSASGSQRERLPRPGTGGMGPAYGAAVSGAAQTQHAPQGMYGQDTTYGGGAGDGGDVAGHTEWYGHYGQDRDIDAGADAGTDIGMGEGDTGLEGDAGTADGSAAATHTLPPLGRPSADDKIAALMAQNEEAIRAGLSKASPGDILSFHQQLDDKGITPQMSMSDGSDGPRTSLSIRDSLTGGSTSTLRVGSGAAKGAQVKLNTATIQLPDVATKKSKKR